MTYKHIYGPVPSRRLGRSLGVDIIPFKTCSYDCMYCQLGNTTNHTIERKLYTEPDEILEELGHRLREVQPDFISFAGSGEPTLNSGLGRIIHGIKALTDVPVVVFTNASLLWMPEVRTDLAEASIVSPSLDAARLETAIQINRLATGLSFEQIYSGLQTFCREYSGRIWLEILFVEGINDSPDDIQALAGALRGMTGIERVQLNTVSRPPAEHCARPLSHKRLQAISQLLPGKIGIIAPTFKGHAYKNQGRELRDEDVIELLERRPCTEAGLAQGLGIEPRIVEKLVEPLVANGTIIPERRGDEIFYIVVG